MRGWTVSSGFRGAAALAVLAALAGSWLPQALAVAPIHLSGELAGIVNDGSGRPQMGAAVLLYNRQNRLIQRILTDERGAFGFPRLTPDLYSVRVTLARFLPAFRDRIEIQPGSHKVLDVSLSSLFSSIQLIPVPPGSSITLMSEDWKWALRTSSASRPILRVLPADPPPAPARQSTSAIFRETRGLVHVSGGDAGDAATGEADLGTTFALATVLSGNARLQLAGNLGYSRQNGFPSAGFQTSYARDIGPLSPELSVTMRQLFVPGRTGLGVIPGPGGDSSLPPVRTMSVSLGQKTAISDNLNMDYGFELDTVSFLDRVHYFSPYARLTYLLPKGRVEMTYTSGNARPELGVPVSDERSDLTRGMMLLAQAPRLSMLAGHPKVQRGENYEMAVVAPLGSSRELRLSAYREAVTNAALNIAGASAADFQGDILPDLFTSSSVFNAGNYRTLGYTASLTQRLGDNFGVTAMYGSVGVLGPRSGQLAGNTADDLRQILEASRRDAFTVRSSGTLKETGTQFLVSYQWMNARAATPMHLYSTQPGRPEPGLNILLRQPVPAVLGLPPHMELTADLRNLLAQGYLPISLADGRQLLLVNTPRSFRGGLSFSF